MRQLWGHFPLSSLPSKERRQKLLRSEMPFRVEKEETQEFKPRQSSVPHMWVGMVHPRVEQVQARKGDMPAGIVSYSVEGM